MSLSLPTRPTLLAIAAAAVLALPALPSWAADVHAGDIEIEIDDGILHTHGAAHTAFANGWNIFEGDFGDTAGGPWRTDDPGFDSADGTFAAGTQVWYRGIGTLQFWTGSVWQAMAADVSKPEWLRLDGNLGEETFFRFGGVDGDVTGLIGEAGADGKIHEHLDMRVARATGHGAPAVGAYLFTLQLESLTLGTSQPFYLVMNNGLDDDAFEASVMALAVPEPSTWALMLAGAGVLAGVARRRSQA
jgi:hypothetical protein